MFVKYQFETSFTDEQMEQKVRISVTDRQRRLVDDAFRFNIDFFRGRFETLNQTVLMHYPKLVDYDKAQFCQTLCELLKMSYFNHIEFNGLGMPRKWIRIHNLNEDLERGHRFTCSVEDALLISQQVLETHGRILCGQLEQIDWCMKLIYGNMLNEYDHIMGRAILDTLKKYYWGFESNQHFGCCGPGVCSAVKCMYQIARWIENDIYGHFRIRGSGNDYANQKPLDITKQRRISVEFI